MVLLTILHQCIGAAYIKKIREKGLLMLPVCSLLPIGGTGSFPLMHWCNWHCNRQ
jgi:hypothetical protein